MKYNKKGEITVNSLVSIILSVIVVLMLFSCAGKMISTSDKYAESQMEKFDIVLQDLLKSNRVTETVDLKVGNEAYFAYFQPGARNLKDISTMIDRPAKCTNLSQSCFCYCDEFDVEESSDRGFVVDCPNKYAVCKSYDTKFKINSYVNFYDLAKTDANSIQGGVFIIDNEGMPGDFSPFAPYKVNFKERLRFEENGRNGEVTLCIRKTGTCSTER